MLFPQALSVPVVPNTPEGHEAFVQQFLLASRAPSESVRAKGSKSDFVRQFLLAPQAQTCFAKAMDVRLDSSHLDAPTILICGHNTRDTRCGVLGPLLRTEFMRHKNRPGSRVSDANVALSSHVGGHAWAGNVIIYFPPTYRLSRGGISEARKKSPLAGMGVWYGRVEPRHVEGIMEETILNGRVIQELLRGVHGASMQQKEALWNVARRHNPKTA